MTTMSLHDGSRLYNQWNMTILCRQDISSHDIDFVEYIGPGVRCCFWLSDKFKHDLWRLKSKLKLSQKQHITPGLTWGRILSTCVISMWNNDIKCKYMCVIPLIKLARKELINHRRRSRHVFVIQCKQSFSKTAFNVLIKPSARSTDALVSFEDILNLQECAHSLPLCFIVLIYWWNFSMPFRYVAVNWGLLLLPMCKWNCDQGC